jgi:methionine aminopeptidase
VRQGSFFEAAQVARAGMTLREVERQKTPSGFSVMKQLCGHGIGLVITVEPIIASGSCGEKLLADG